VLEVMNNLKADSKAVSDLLVDENLPEWIFDCFIKNWESPVK